MVALYRKEQFPLPVIILEHKKFHKLTQLFADSYETNLTTIGSYLFYFLYSAGREKEFCLH